MLWEFSLDNKLQNQYIRGELIFTKIRHQMGNWTNFNPTDPVTPKIPDFQMNSDASDKY